MKQIAQIDAELERAFAALSRVAERLAGERANPGGGGSDSGLCDADHGDRDARLLVLKTG